MSNDPKVDLIYAILAMDAYNRGYGTSITELDEAGEDARLGNYSIVPRLSQAGWFNAGFYALAYRKAGETVISYRGTDVKGLSADELAGGSDPLNGYGLATGLTAYDADGASKVGCIEAAPKCTRQPSSRCIPPVATCTLPPSSSMRRQGSIS